MDYREMQQAEAALANAINPPKKQRGATKAQLDYRARMLEAALLREIGTDLEDGRMLRAARKLERGAK